MSFVGVAIGAGVGLVSSLVLPPIQGKPITWEGVVIGTAGGALGGAAGSALAPAVSAGAGAGAGGGAGTIGGATGGVTGGATGGATGGVTGGATGGVGGGGTLSGVGNLASNAGGAAFDSAIGTPVASTLVAPTLESSAGSLLTPTIESVGADSITSGITSSGLGSAPTSFGSTTGNVASSQVGAPAFNSSMSGATPITPAVPAVADTSNMLQKGIAAVKEADPNISYHLSGGMAGTSLAGMVTPPAPGPQYKKTPVQNIYDPIPYTQQDIPRTTIPKYYQYADGGIIPPQPQQEVQPQQPMNKFAQMGLDIAKQIQAQNQPKQAAPQAGIPVPPTQMQPPMGAPQQVPMQQQAPMQPQMGIPQQAPMQPQQNFAVGGLAQNNVNDTQNNTNDDFFRQVQAGVFQQLTDQTASQRAPGAQTAQSIEPVAPVTPIQPITAPTQNAAGGGIMRDNLGGYSHGGIAGLTRGPGDGVSDSIPAQIGGSGKQPARLADGEFVVPARIVSELGNGSTEAGAKALQAMVDRVQARRSKTVGKGKVAVNSKARKGLPA